MSGHNKWTQIKRKKEVVDAKKSKLFSALTKNLQLEAKKAGGDRNSSGLKAAVDRARAANLPNENIERAIKAATDPAGAILEAARYEAYGPEGVAMIIEAITDNKNRTAQEIKHLLAEHGATFAAPGAAVWAFKPSVGENGTWQPKLIRTVSDAARDAVSVLVAVLAAHADVQTVSFDIDLPTQKR